MVHSPDEMVQRKHHFAMVDEVDSVLIDDARTPLIICGPVPRGDEHEFLRFKTSYRAPGNRAEKFCYNQLKVRGIQTEVRSTLNLVEQDNRSRLRYERPDRIAHSGMPAKFIS